MKNIEKAKSSTEERTFFEDEYVAVRMDGDIVSIRVEEDEQKASYTLEQAKEILAALEPDLKSRGRFFRRIGGLVLRSSDCKSVVRLLRKLLKETKSVDKKKPKSPIEEALDSIVPGETYPRSVSVREPDGNTVRFGLNSFIVGMYCVISLNGEDVEQTGDHDNVKVVKGLKRDIKAAITRGADVKIGPIAKVLKL